MDKSLQEKLKNVVEKVTNAMVDPDIDIEFCIGGVETTSDECNTNEEPYIVVKYTANDNDTHIRKIHLNQGILATSAEEIANFITFSIEEFKSEVDGLGNS